MKKLLLVQLLMVFTTVLCAQPVTDPRSLRFMGIPLEGSIDSLSTSLVDAELLELWEKAQRGEKINKIK